MTAIKLEGFDIERSKQVRKTQKNIKAAIELIFDEINAYGNQDIVGDALLANITGQHRTLQQDFWRTMFSVIDGYGELEYCDGRNAAAVQACKAIAASQERYGQVMPRI